MKRLLVLRHAKAELESTTGRDFDRPLAKRGWKHAVEVGRTMRERGLGPAAIIASPAKRVAETLAAVAEGYGPLTPDFDERIYNASPGTLLDVVREADDSARTLLLVGHNPGLLLLLLDLTRDDGDARRARIEQGFPTAALAVVDLPATTWAEVEAGGGQLVDLILR